MLNLRLNTLHERDKDSGFFTSEYNILEYDPLANRRTNCENLSYSSRNSRKLDAAFQSGGILRPFGSF